MRDCGCPVGRRKNDRPEIGRGPVEFKSDVVELQALLVDADDAATHLHLVLGIVEQEGLSNVEMGAHQKETAVGIDDLCFGLLLELLALFVFGKYNHANAQNDAFAPAPV